MAVDANQKVVGLQWSYSNADGTLGNHLKLATPYGDVPLTTVTEATAISWLETQLGNTTEQFDAELAKRKAAAEYKETLVPYTCTDVGTFVANETVSTYDLSY